MQRTVELKKVSEEVLATGTSGHFRTVCSI